jgi:putative ABC transport system permease protein
VLSVALATLRRRWVSFAGAVLALTLGSGVVAMMTMALAAASATPFPGPQRFAAAPAVVVPHRTVRLTVDGFPADLPVPRPGGLSRETLARLATTGRTIPDRTFPARLAQDPAGQVGHAWSAAAFTPYRLVAGRAPAAAGEIVVGGGDPTLVGHRVQVTTRAGNGAYMVTGVTAPVWFEHAIFFSDEAAARISPMVDAAVTYGPLDAVGRAAGDATRVLTGDARQEADPDPSGGADQLSDAQAMAGTSAALGLSVAVFVVIATFAFVTEQRRRELGLLRTVGATPRQVRRLVVTEAAFIGVVASAVGCALGSLTASPLSTWMIGHQVAPPWFTIDVAPMPILVSFAIGLTSAVLGAAVASRRAARVRPTEALRDAAVDHGVMTVTRWLLGIGLLAVATYATLTTVAHDPGHALSVKRYLPAFLPLIGGFALLAPVILQPVARLATWPLGRMGAGSTVVRASALTAGRRTAATVAPIVVALGLAISILTVQATADDTHNAAMRRQTRADFTVVPTRTADLDPRMVTAIRRVPDADVTVWTSAQIRLATDSDAYIDTLDAQATDLAALPATQRLTPVAGSLASLDNHSVIIDQGTARDHGLRAGDRVKAYLSDGTSVPLRIAAVIRTGVSEETVYLPAPLLPGGGATRIDVKARSSATPAALRAAVRGQDAQVIPIGRYLDAVRSRQQRETRQAITVILGVALAYSFVAVANTMVMAISGRGHEIVALRLAGATRRQVLRFIAAESALVVLVGAILAAGAAGMVVVGQRAALTRLLADPPVSVPWMLTGEITAACGAVAMVVSILSAWRALQAPPGGRSAEEIA